MTARLSRIRNVFLPIFHASVLGVFTGVFFLEEKTFCLTMYDCVEFGRIKISRGYLIYCEYGGDT